MTPLKRILGLDYGTKRIGVAVSDPLRMIATGLTVVANSPDAFAQIKRIVNEYDVEKIVVGMPFNLKGEKGVKANEVEEFMGRLETVVGIEVVAFDERFTSQIAQETVRMMGMKKKQRQSKARIDLMASALILQGYLDAAKS